MSTGLTTDDVLVGRYRLLEPVGPAAEAPLSDVATPAELWLAYDEVLARQVAVRALPAANKVEREAARPFLEAAIRSGQFAHPSLVRVYDAGLTTDRGRGKDVAYLVREWVAGAPLDRSLASTGPLDGVAAADVVRQLADALTAVHAGGVAHGRLHPGNVLLVPGGRARLCDTLLSAVLHDPPPASTDAAGLATATDPATDPSVDPSADTAGLAAVLYALLTCRWPGGTAQPPGALELAPQSGGRPLSPHQVRAGVPRALDAIVLRGLEQQRPGAFRNPDALAGALDAAVAQERELRAAPVVPRQPGRVRTALPWLLALFAIGAVGAIGWVAGIAIGTLAPRADGVTAIVTTSDAPTPGVSATRTLGLTRLPIRDFDPAGDNQENSDKVANAIDGFPDTTWPTSRYKSATFGGLKPGVGLLLDLGRPTVLASVQVGFSAPGAQVELRLSDTAPTTIDDTKVVAAARGGQQVAVLTPAAGTRGRYLVVWITSLPKDGDGYRVGISELRVTTPA